MGEEIHERKFRGVWIPAWIFDMFENEKNDLRPRDILMYANIDSLHDEKKGGCWASNAYLGKRTGISEDLAGRVVNKLIRLGMVNNIGFDGRHRYLVVCYDRETGKRVKKAQTASGKRGNQHRGNARSRIAETPDQEQKGEQKGE